MIPADELISSQSAVIAYISRPWNGVALKREHPGTANFPTQDGSLVFTKPGCGQCVAMYRELKIDGIEHNVHDLATVVDPPLS